MPKRTGVKTSAVIAETATAASYERVSTRMQGATGFSLGAQEKDAAAFAREHGWTLPDQLRFRDGEDHAASGADWDLEGLNAAMDAAKRGEYQILIVPDPDRFARNMVKALVLEEQLRKHGVRVVYIRMPLEDTAEGRLLKHQLFSIAEYEREKITFRTARGRREKAERGLVVGAGPCPYGYRYVRAGERSRIVGLELDPDTAPAVERIFRDSLAQSTRQLVESLRNEGVKQPRAPWTTAAVFRILTNPTYAGSFVYGGRGRQRAAHFAEPGDAPLSVSVPPIVDRPTWDAVQIAMARRRTLRVRPGASETDQFALRGLLTCGECGGGLSAWWNTGRRGRTHTTRYYHCLRNEPHRARILGKPHCGMRDVPAEPLEDLVWQMIAGTLLDPERLRQGLADARAQHSAAVDGRADRLASIDRELARQKTRLERVLDELIDTPKANASYDGLSQRRQVIEAAIQRLNAEHAEFSAPPAIGLSDEQANELARFAVDIAAGLEHASPSDRRWVYDRLRLHGTLRLDAEHGLQIGTRHRFDLEFEAAIPIPDSVSSLKNKLTIYPTVASFLRLHLLGERASGSR